MQATQDKFANGSGGMKLPKETYEAEITSSPGIFSTRIIQLLIMVLWRDWK